MAALTLQRAVVVNGGHRPWVVTDISQINGIDFVRLAWDSGFNRFLGCMPASRAFSEALMALRNEACMRAISGDQPSMDGEVRLFPTPARAGSTWATRKRFASLKKMAQHQSIDLVTMQLPAFEYNGVSHGPLEVQTPFTLRAGSVVSVPLTTTVIEYIRDAYLKSDIVERPERPLDAKADAPRGSYFDERRGPYGAFVVRHRTSAGKYEYVVVPVIDGNQEAARVIVQTVRDGGGVDVPRRGRPRRRAAAHTTSTDDDDHTANSDDDQPGAAAAEPPIRHEDCDDVD